MASLADAALRYARAGHAVFPVHSIHDGACTCGNPTCSSPGKHPCTAQGFKDATTDAATITRWWTERPEANIGLATGALAVLDVDPRHSGDRSLERLIAEHGPLPDTLRVRTGGGGLHYWFAVPEPIPSKTGFAPGLDLKCRGGYIVVPPSLHISGERYQFEQGGSAAPIPPWLALIVQPQRADRTPPTPAVPDDRLDDSWSGGALVREYDRVTTCPGGARNDTLNEAAFNLGQIVGGGGIVRSVAEDTLLRAALACGLPERDSRATIASGINAGIKKPRKRPRRDPPTVAGLPAPSANGNRPRIVVREELDAVCREAEAALTGWADSGLYVRGRMLARMVIGRSSAGLSRHPESPVIEAPISKDTLARYLDRAAEWIKWDSRRRGGGGYVPARPPEWVASVIGADGEWALPRLNGIVSAPTLRPDGSILCQPGYDPDTGLIYRPDAEYPEIPSSPTRGDAIRATEALTEPLSDFPWVALSDLAAAVSAILALAGRAAILGPVPLYAVRAPVPGAGKSLLADVVATIGSGRPAARTTAPKEDAELRKVILTVMLEGDGCVLLDNVAGVLGSATLAAALTATEWKDRLLGHSRRVEGPLTTVWLATGNGLVFRGDLGRRVIPIDIDPGLEHPEDREGFRYPDLRPWVTAERPRLLAAALTILRSYHLAGRPRHDRPRKGSFEAWDDFVRGAVRWVGLADPHDGVGRIRSEDDSELTALRMALEACGDAFGGNQWSVGQAVSACANNADLRDSLADLSGTSPIDARRLGVVLRKSRNRIVDGRFFSSVGRRWRVVSVSEQELV